MKILYAIVFCICLPGIYTDARAQAVSYVDAGQAYLRLYLESNDNAYTRVNNYKVAGIPYLFGSGNNANVYGKKEGGDGLKVSYNTYSQMLEIAAPGLGKFIEKSPLEIDSFLLLKSDNSPYDNDIVFKSSQLFGEKKLYFLQEVYNGQKYSLYKAYRSELGLVSTNYGQSDLRQFDLKFEYFYTENIIQKKLIKLRVNKKSIFTEFKSIRDLSSVLYTENFDVNLEKNLVTIFRNYLN